MKINTSFKRFFGITTLLLAVLFIAPACGTETVDTPETETTEQTEENSSILEERTAFWKEWNEKCAPPTTETNASIFKTLGKDYETFKTNDTEVWQAMIDLYQTPEDGEKWLPGLIESGSTYPIPVHAYAGQKLYKIVAAGKNISSPSAYYMTEMQLEKVKMHPADLEQTLGLPLQSCAGEYWIYSITSLVDDNVFFQSSIAPTEQYASATPEIVYHTPGGGVQSLLINNMDPLKWKKSEEPDEKYIPDTLPHIAE